MRRTTTIFIIGVALLLAACGGGDDVGAPTTTNTDGDDTTTTGGGDSGAVPPEIGGDGVILEVTHEGGFVAVEVAYDPMPTYMLLADGRLLAPDITTLEFPGPLMPAVQEIHLDDGTVAELLDLAAEIGLPDIQDDRVEDAVNVADAPDTVFTYHDDNGEHRFAVYALGAGESADARVEASQRLMAALETAAAEGEPVGPYQPEAVAVAVTDGFGGENEATAEVLDWPLPVSAGDIAEVGTIGLRCLVLEGEDAVAALSVFDDATQTTYFEEEGTVYRLTPRPLFPGETGCPM